MRESTVLLRLSSLLPPASKTYAGGTMSVMQHSPFTEKPTWVLLLVLFNGLAVVTLLASISDDASVGSILALIAYVVVVDAGLANRSRLRQRSRAWMHGWLLAISLLLIVLVAVMPVGVYLWVLASLALTQRVRSCKPILRLGFSS